MERKIVSNGKTGKRCGCMGKPLEEVFLLSIDIQFINKRFGILIYLCFCVTLSNLDKNIPSQSQTKFSA